MTTSGERVTCLSASAARGSARCLRNDTVLMDAYLALSALNLGGLFTI